MTVRVMPLLSIRMLLSVLSCLGDAAAVVFPDIGPPNAKLMFMGLIKGRLCEIALGLVKVFLTPAALRNMF